MILRNDQLDALREAQENPPAWDRAARMAADLEDLGFFEHGSVSLDHLLSEFRNRRPLAKAADSEIALRALIAEDIDRALGFGIKSELLLLHFVAFTFRHGLDWTRDEAIETLLDRQDLEEAAKVSEVRRALQRR